MTYPWNVPTPAEARAIVEEAMRRAPDETLTHDVHGPYLEKWLVERRTGGFARYVHRFLRPDADSEMHNHPWDNRTMCVEDGYDEVTPDGKTRIAPGDLAERRATDFHRVDFADGSVPVTIFDHGPKVNDWGFRQDDGGFVPWRDFAAESGAYRI